MGDGRNPATAPLPLPASAHPRLTLPQRSPLPSRGLRGAQILHTHLRGVQVSHEEELASPGAIWYQVSGKSCFKQNQ